MNSDGIQFAITVEKVVKPFGMPVLSPEKISHVHTVKYVNNNKPAILIGQPIVAKHFSHEVTPMRLTVKEMNNIIENRKKGMLMEKFTFQENRINRQMEKYPGSLPVYKF
jgi:hypothetical protein